MDEKKILEVALNKIGFEDRPGEGQMVNRWDLLAFAKGIGESLAVQAESAEHKPLGPATPEDQAIYDGMAARYFKEPAATVRHCSGCGNLAIENHMPDMLEPGQKLFLHPQSADFLYSFCLGFALCATLVAIMIAQSSDTIEGKE